jgi:1,4-alpha-glucan branching enzyme
MVTKKKAVKSVVAQLKEFKLYAPQAKKVSVAGSFNSWDVRKSPAKKDTKGAWLVKLKLKPGRHEYKFVVDGNWITDPNCTHSVWNAVGSQNSLIEIK